MKMKKHEEFVLWRKKRNLSQKDLAERFNVSQGYISHMEKGIRPVPKKIRDAMPSSFRISEGEEFGIRIRRQGLNMNSAVKLFRKAHQTLLHYIRGEMSIPKEVWEILEDDERKYEEYKARKLAESKAKKEAPH